MELEMYRKQCEKDGDYLNANGAKEAIIQLRLEGGQKQLQALLLKQQQEKLAIEEAHVEE